jgi:class 3 adenylate cyclase/tetratricopeptide (TPR) repeat protein
MVAAGLRWPYADVVARTAGTDALLGEELAGYRVETRIGRGGMGVVYLAEDVRLGRMVALKVLAPDLAADERFRERFLRESRLAASLDHPNVVPVFEAGEASGALFIAMRYVEGPDLGALIGREGALEPHLAIDLVRQAAEALDAAHRRGLVHRDVKPANILVDAGRHAYLTDFGLSRLVGASSLTGSGQFVGTVEYVAPEQIEGAEIGPPADVYSLGAVLVECLTGSTPYPYDSNLAVLWAHIQDDPPSVSARRPSLPIALDAVVARALAKKPDERFARCGELVESARLALAEGLVPISARRAPGPTRKTVTVLFADLATTSAAGEPADPEAIGRAKARCLDEMTDVLEHHGAAVERLPGHGLLGVFGLPAVREDDALRAVRAATELRERVGAAARELAETAAVSVAARVGIDTGEVIASGPGAAPGDLGGTTLDLAAGLEEAAGPDEILLGSTTHDLLSDRVVVEEVELGDHGGSRGAWRLVTLLRDPPTLSRGGPAARMVGRDRELGELRRAFDEAVATRSCRLVTVLGQAGIGKSRLAGAMAAALDEEATILGGRCLSYGEGITYWPLQEIVRALASGSDPLTALRQLLGPEEKGAVAAELVATAAGLAESPATREEIFWAVRRLFEALARRRPLVVVLEDAHWAERTLLDLVEHVVRGTRDAPLLLVCLARPDLVDSHPGFGELPGSATLDLQPLTRGEAALLLGDLTGGAALPPELADRIVEIAEGNPFFLEQLLAMTTEVDPGGPRLTLPPAIQALISARLDRLPADERHVIECASIQGLVFHVGPLTELCEPVGDGALWRHLLALTRKELVRPDRSDVPDDEALRFQHALIREAAYHGIAKERRADLHERFGLFLERTHAHAQTALELEEIVGYHLEQAVRNRREAGAGRDTDAALAEQASARLAAAGRRALARLDLPAAINLLERAAALLPSGESRRALLDVDRAAALLEAGRLDQADALLATIEDRPGTDADVAANAAVQRLLVRYSVDLGTALADLRRLEADLRRVLEKAEDDQGLYRLWLLHGLASWAEGRAARAAEAWERAGLHAERAGDRLARVDLLCWLASATFFGPTPVPEGVARCEAILEQVGDQPYGRARVLHPLAGLHAMAGRFEIANALLEDGNAIREELGSTLQWAVSHAEALVALLERDLERAEKHLSAGYAQLEEMGERGYLSMTAALLARVAVERGLLADALRFADECRETSAAEDAWPQVLWRGIKARVLVRQGATEEALRLGREAVAIAERTDFLSSHGDALLDLADVLTWAGRLDDARRAAVDALDCYERKGDDVSAVRAREILDSLPAG